MEAAKVISKFQAGIKDLQAEIKWFLQISPSNVAHVHLHFIVLSWDRISQETIRALWTKALGEWYSPRKSSVYFKRPQSLKGIAKYVTGDTKKKFNDPLFRKGLPRQVKVSGGTIKFFAGPVDKLYKAIARHHRAWLEFRAADDDGWWNRIQSGTDLQAHYLAVVDADHEAYLDHAFDRRAGMPLPAVEDWEALFATTPPTPPLPIYKTTTRPQLPLEAEEVPLEAEEVAPAVEATPANIQENSEDRLRQVHEFATEGLPPRHGGGVPPPYVKGEARRRNTPFETSKGTQRHQLVPNPGRPSPIEAPPRPLRSP